MIAELYTVRLSFTEAGQGMPVVLLHGYPLSGSIWRMQQELSDEYRVITPDLRGHGKSPAPLGVYAMDVLARDVLALLDSLEIPKAAILGHSMGGYVALAAWHLAPERFLALGLIDSQAAADAAETRQARHQMAEKVAVHGSQVVAAAMLPKLFAPYLPADELIVDQVRHMILGTQPSGIIGSLRGMAARPDAERLLPRLNIPVLVLTGDEDQLIPIDKARTLAAAIPTASLAIVANAGHLPMLEQPEATTTAIRSFLSAIAF